ncbi:MAG: DUF421 domain-containing protein [Caulobacteraceae bacterium]
MAQSILYAALRAVFAYLLFLSMSRLVGRKAISQFTFFDFVASISLGSVTANLAMGPQSNFYSTATVLVVFSLLATISGIIHMKSFKARKLLNSEPVVVVDKGQIVEQNMKKIRMSIDDLTSLLRDKNVFNMADVEFAIMENDGKLSVLPKSQKQPLTPSDFNLSPPYRGLTKDIIIDGNIMHENLRSSSRDESWLLNELGKQGISDASQVFYAGIDSSGSLYISKKHSSVEKHGQHGIE